MNKKGLKRLGNNAVRFTFMLCSISSVISLLAITIFILASGIPGIAEIGFSNFIFGDVWQPLAGIFGVFPMIIGSLFITLGALLIGFPLGFFTAIFLSEIAPPRLQNILRPMVNLLAAIPSVVYGFFGLMVIVPIVMNISGPGNSILSAVMVLAIMIFPTVVSISEASISSVPQEYKEGSYALGETKMSTIFRVTVPAAKSGIFTSLALATGRAIGEATAVVLVAGNTVQVPGSIFDSVRTLTANCAIEMGYASGIHAQALYATAVVLFVFIMLINLSLLLINRKKED